VVRPVTDPDRLFTSDLGDVAGRSVP